MVTSDDAPADRPALTLESMTEEQFQQLLKETVASLGGFRCFSHAARQDIAGEAILQVLDSGRLDPSREPVAYIKKAAARLAAKWSRQLKAETLVDDGRHLEAAAAAAACREGHSTDPQECMVRDGDAANRNLWGPTDDEEFHRSGRRCHRRHPRPPDPESGPAAPTRREPGRQRRPARHVQESGRSAMAARAHRDPQHTRDQRSSAAGAHRVGPLTARGQWLTCTTPTPAGGPPTTRRTLW